MTSEVVYLVLAIVLAVAFIGVTALAGGVFLGRTSKN